LAPPPGNRELRCLRCDGLIRTPTGRTWWKTVWAMAVGSVRGVILGVMASPLLMLVTEGPRSSDGTGGALLVALPVVGGLLGFLLGLAIPLLQRARSGPGNARAEPATLRTKALTLARVAAAPPAVGLVLVSAGWLVCARIPNTDSALNAHEIIGYWAFVVCLATPFGASMALWALLTAWWASRKHPAQSDTAPLRRRLAVRLALVALVLNVAAPWLLREGLLLPARNRYYDSRSDLPSAVPISRPPDSSGENPSGPPAIPTARPQDRPQPKGSEAG
jgi:hypothetical protein